MEKNLKAIVIVLLAACVAFLVGTVALFFMRQIEIEKRLNVEKQVTELTTEKGRLSKELSDTIVARKDLERQLTSVVERSKAVEAQLAQEKQTRDAVIAQLESEKGESKRLVDELTKLKDTRDELEGSLKKIKDDYESVKARLASVQQAKEVMEAKFKEQLAKSQVELGKIVVTPETPIPPVASVENAALAAGAGAESPSVSDPSSIIDKPENVQAAVPLSRKKGEVVVVNKKFDFVIVSLGESDGMRPGTELGIY
ncbi:MAG: hypothetical protein WCG78_08620, partial [Candidatus Omnitrophota bacterium]